MQVQVVAGASGRVSAKARGVKSATFAPPFGSRADVNRKSSTPAARMSEPSCCVCAYVVFEEKRRIAERREGEVLEAIRLARRRRLGTLDEPLNMPFHAAPGR